MDVNVKPECVTQEVMPSTRAMGPAGFEGEYPAVGSGARGGCDAQEGCL